MKKGITFLVIALGLSIPFSAVNASTQLICSQDQILAQEAMFGEGLVIIFQGLTDTTVDVYDTSEATLILEDGDGKVWYNGTNPAPSSRTFDHNNYPTGEYKLTILNENSDVIKYEPALFRNQ